MFERFKDYLPPTFTLVGTTIGAGILALPYAFSQGGIVSAYLSTAVVACLMLLLNLVYAEVLTHSNGKHQLAGYVGELLGRKGKLLATIAVVVGANGALLAYTIQSGKFLHTLFPVVSSFYFSLAFFFIFALLILMSIESFSLLETAMVVGLLSMMALIIVVGVPEIDMVNFVGFGNSLESIVLPYGVLLFAFSGYSVVPELGEMTGYNPKLMKRTIVIGTLLVAVVYVAFATVVTGISGGQTSDDAITGLLPFLDGWVITMGIVIALVGIGTSFISLGHVLKDLYHADLGLDPHTGWFLTVYPPLLIFLWGELDFVEVLQISGTVTVGLTGTLLFLMYLEIAHRKDVVLNVIKVRFGVIYVGIAVFIIGVMFELVKDLL